MKNVCLVTLSKNGFHANKLITECENTPSVITATRHNENYLWDVVRRPCGIIGKVLYSVQNVLLS